MKAIEISRPGGPEVLTPVEQPAPEPAHDEIRIRVAYAGVNRPDALQRAGRYDPPVGANPTPGLEVSGEIEAMGAGVTGWRLGDKVCALVPGGGYAEMVVTPAAHALPVPDGIDLREAAGLPETYFTVWTNVFLRGGLKAGERFMVHGGTSGIGTTAIQLARALGARVFATAGSDEKVAVCEQLGAEAAFNYKTQDFTALMQEQGGADLILDMVGGSYIQRNLDALAVDGRLVQIAFLEGPEVPVDFTKLMGRRLTFTGSTLRPQSILAKAGIARDLRRHAWPLLANGRLKPVIDSEFALADAVKAHTRLEADHIGKVLLRVA